MLIEHQSPFNKSIMAAVLGAPNAGKSSLINYLLGMDLTVVTHKPQTTRNRFHCVFTVDHTEIILVDTPGIHNSNSEFNKRMNEQAREGVDGVDINLLMIDLNRSIMPQFTSFNKVFEKELGKTWIIFNKSDRVENAEQLPFNEVIESAKELFPNIEKYFVISCKNGDGMHLLTGALCDEAHESPHLYDGVVSNKNERFFATEYIREQAFQLLKDEIPYEVAVTIDEYKDFKEKEDRDKKIISHISASILVNRPSQRAIVIGKGGAMIKEIGTRARMKIENMVGGQVHLNLHVKVMPRWFKNNFVLEELGLPRAKDSNRLWRKS